MPATTASRTSKKILVISKSKREKLTSPIKRDRLKSAVAAVLENLRIIKDENEILDPVRQILLFVTLHKQIKLRYKVLFTLPHPMYKKEVTEICVFTKDIFRQDYTKTIEIYEKKFRKFGLTKVKIIPLTSLKKDYRSSESKALLGKSYSLYVADTCLQNHIHQYLGKEFFCTAAARKLHSIDLSSHYLRELFKEVFNASMWRESGRQESSRIVVAPSSFPVDDIVDNLDSCIKGVALTALRGWENVRYLHIGAEKTLRYPIYANEDVSDDIETADCREVRNNYNQSVKKIDGDDLYSMRDYDIQLLLFNRLKELRRQDVTSKKRKLADKMETDADNADESSESVENVDWSTLEEEVRDTDGEVVEDDDD